MNNKYCIYYKNTRVNKRAMYAAEIDKLVRFKGGLKWFVDNGYSLKYVRE